ncbi:MAG: tail fiber protein [Actinobacteria bacterium]|nr:tail fiber protein [Actinomycetota bacterium]
MPGGEPANSLRISQLATTPAPVPLTAKIPVVIGGATRVVTLNALLNSVTGGTVNSISQGAGVRLSPNPITTTGTISFHLPGLVIPYAGQTEPLGWVFCNGSSYPVDGVYSDLFSIVGYTYGGSGNSFKVPDLRGRMVSCGYSGGGLGSSGGEETVVLASTQVALKDHVHQQSTPNICMQASPPGSCCTDGKRSQQCIGATRWNAGGTSRTWYASGALTANSPLSATPHNNIPPGLVMNFIVKL